MVTFGFAGLRVDDHGRCAGVDRIRHLDDEVASRRAAISAMPSSGAIGVQASIGFGSDDVGREAARFRSVAA